jgi:hypothetical protein
VLRPARARARGWPSANLDVVDEPRQRLKPTILRKVTSCPLETDWPVGAAGNLCIWEFASRWLQCCRQIVPHLLGLWHAICCHSFKTLRAGKATLTAHTSCPCPVSARRRSSCDTVDRPRCRHPGHANKRAITVWRSAVCLASDNCRSWKRTWRLATNC